MIDDGVDRGPQGGGLLEDVDAVLLALDHPGDPADLALDAAEATDELGPVPRVAVAERRVVAGLGLRPRPRLGRGLRSGASVGRHPAPGASMASASARRSMLMRRLQGGSHAMILPMGIAGGAAVAPARGEPLDSRRWTCRRTIPRGPPR